MSYALRSLMLAALLSSNIALQADTASEHATALKTIFADIKTLNKGVPLNDIITPLKEKQTFTEAELLALCEVATKKLRPYDDVLESPSYEQLDAITKMLVAQLKEYKISGFGFTTHFSGSLFYGRQNFDTDLVYKNSKGAVCNQTANIKYSSIGWQAELVWRFDLVFAVGTDLSRYSTRMPLEFDRGFTAGYKLPIGPKLPDMKHKGDLIDMGRLSLGNIGITVLPIKDQKGSLVIAHLGAGLTGTVNSNLISLQKLQLALVMAGGSFTPIK